MKAMVRSVLILLVLAPLAMPQLVSLTKPGTASPAGDRAGAEFCTDLTGQHARDVAALRGKIVAVTFIYTGCPDICPLLTEKMVQVQDELGRISARKSPSCRSPSIRNTIRRRC